MERVLCFILLCRIQLAFFPLHFPFSWMLSKSRRDFFLSPLNDIFHHKSAEEAGISIRIGSWSYT